MNIQEIQEARDDLSNIIDSLYKLSQVDATHRILFNSLKNGFNKLFDEYCELQTINEKNYVINNRFKSFRTYDLSDPVKNEKMIDDLKNKVAEMREQHHPHDFLGEQDNSIIVKEEHKKSESKKKNNSKKSKKSEKKQN